MAGNKNKPQKKLNKINKNKNKKTASGAAVFNEGINSHDSKTLKKKGKNRAGIDLKKEGVNEVSSTDKNTEQKNNIAIKNIKNVLDASDIVIEDNKCVKSSQVDTKSATNIAQATTNKQTRKSEYNTPSNSTNKLLEDETIEVQIKSKKQKRNLNPEEAAVRDEDIDKFCEELTEEDNVQYENWVKLIEANFKKPSRNKTT